MVLNIFIILIILEPMCFCENANGKRYYFKMGKSGNDHNNNQIHFLNHNITDYDYTHKRVDNLRILKLNEEEIKHDYYLDEEWKYERKNFSKTDLPLFVHKLYEKISENIRDVNTVRVLFNAHLNSSSSIIYFNLNSFKSDDTILDAELYFYWTLKNNSKAFGESVVLRLYQFEKQLNGAFSESDLIQNPDIHKLFNVIYISKAQRGWQTFKIKKPIDNWLSGEENLGILLTISSYDDNKLISIFNDTNEGSYRTFAIIHVDNNDLKTKTSEELLDHKYSILPQCRKRDWEVTFKSLHWDDFIIAPDGFTASDCAGKCNKPQEDDLNHMKLLYIFNKRSSCCVPTSYLPIPIMFFNEDGNVVIKSYDNLIVANCGCR